MNPFPHVDPIPLPAPVWLFKLLSLLTLGLHFSAVMLLVGSLALVVWLNYSGRQGKNLERVKASYTLAKRMPVIMTYVINLGVPPLLFLQVLYGRQVYSSSVLIGVAWISVIFLLMALYWLIYRTVAAIENSKPAWGLALLSLVIVLGIGQIYSMNMTLMLRPEVWREMYTHSPQGLQGVHGDPTMTPRWLFVMAGGPVFGGLWAALLSNMKYLEDGVREVLRKSGGVFAAVGALLMLLCGAMVIGKQPDAIRSGLTSTPLTNIGLILCGLTIVLSGAIGLLQGVRPTNPWISSIGLVTAFLAASTAGIVRDGIRDMTLYAKGFDVTVATVYPNWSVLIAFFLLFVAMLAIIYWLLMVMKQATPPKEEIAL